MKIIISVNTYYPLKDGVQGVTQYQAESLASKGHDVTVVTKQVKNSSDFEVYNGVQIIRINIYDKYTLHFGDKREYRKLILDLTKKADVFVAVCLQCAVTDWLLGIMDEISCPKCLYMHGMHDFKWYKHNFKDVPSFAKKILRDIRWGFFYPFSFKNIRKFDIVSHLHKFDNAYKYFEKHNLGKCIVLENSAEDEFFLDSLQRKEELPKKYMISVANYDTRKNQQMSLKAFYEAKTNDYALVFIGSKSNKYYQRLLSYKRELEGKFGKKEVYLLTDISRDQVCEYVKYASCYLLTSTWEAFPISIIEAMASGVPFISTDVGILRYLPGGVLVKNIEELRNWIECFINDPQVAEFIGKSGKKYAEDHLSLEINKDKFENILFGIYNNSNS